ncbi:MAG: lysine biosynthesis protein LysX [Candidatus Jordarchaeales archaeon]
MITIGIICDRVRWDEKELIKAARKRGAKPIVIDQKNIVLDLTGSGDNIPEADVYLQRSVSTLKGLYITKILEDKGYMVINSFEPSRICADKLLTTLALVKAGVPTPHTLVAFDVESGLDALDKLGYPAVIKPVIGSWGRFVALLKDRQTAKSIMEERVFMGALYQTFYLQEYVEKNGRDIRSFVIGDRVVAAIYRIAVGDELRTNTALGGRAEPCPITPDLEELSLKAAEAVGGNGVYGIDIFIGDKGMMVNEVNHTVEFHTTVPITGIDIPGLIIDYVLERVK